MTLLLKPLEKRGLVPACVVEHRVTLLAVLLFACAMPDIDFLIGVFAPGTALGSHGLGMHSLVMMGLCSALLAGLWWARFRAGFVAVLLLTLAASWSHLLMDMMTYRSRGIGLLWPIIDERLRLPFQVFYGVRHSGSGNWLTHLITVSTESAFLVLVWGLSRLLMRNERAPRTPPNVEVEQA